MPVSADRSRDGARPACRGVGLGVVAAAVVAAAGLPGCGPPRPPTFRVDGMLRDTGGIAVERASVTFLSGTGNNDDLPPATGKTYRAEGIVGEGGRFTLTTFQPGDGAVAGTHRVLLVPLPAGDGPTASVPVIPAKYEHPDHSGLVVEVEPKAVNEVILVIERGPARQPQGGG